jgi:stearoyl-CoA desaturase (Delta-9 desaturase)
MGSPEGTGAFRLAGGPRRAAAASRYPNVLDYAGYAGMHLACLGALGTGCSGRYAAICGVSYCTRMFALMAGYHRYFSHRAFKTSRTMQFLLALVGTLGVQKGVLWWASHHRYHHRFSDTEHDIHSPIHRSFLYSHSGWFLDSDNRDTDYSRVGDLTRYPELVWLNEWGLVPISAYALLLFMLFGWGGLVWGFFVSTVLIWHAIHAIGSFGHRYGGYRRFATADNSRNKGFLALVLLGEGWHNNHHFYPSSARQGFAWWELDVVYSTLRCMERLGLVWDLRVPPERVRREMDPRAQAQVRRCEQWLRELRLGLAARIDAAAIGAAAIGADIDAIRIELLKQAAERLLDLFGPQTVGQLIHDPEAIEGSLAVLRHDFAEEARGFPPAIARALDDELAARLPEAPFARLLARPNAVPPLAESSAHAC